MAKAHSTTCFGVLPVMPPKTRVTYSSSPMLLHLKLGDLHSELMSCSSFLPHELNRNLTFSSTDTEICSVSRPESQPVDPKDSLFFCDCSGNRPVSSHSRQAMFQQSTAAASARRCLSSSVTNQIASASEYIRRVC